ncbi:unnamed protein product, partial [Schistosoma curassoni]|uniref:Ubiquitin-like domain-containing protein n=1 Tax=Schistosoma curassoni TaxID=6186 RepID=A0A183JV05_9TREM
HTHTDLPIDLILPTIEQITISIRRINSGKAARPDNIPVKALRSRIEVTTNMLHVLLRKICEEEQVPPTDWKEQYIFKIPNKGDMSEYQNYTGITLLSVPRKIFNSDAEPDERLSRCPTG